MTDPARFELFSVWHTSATYRVRVAFNLEGVQPKEHGVNLDAGEQRGEAFLKINPMGRRDADPPAHSPAGVPRGLSAGDPTIPGQCPGVPCPRA